MVTATTRLTIEEFERLPTGEERWELVNGELVELNAASTNHGAIAGRITGLLFVHIHQQRLGEVFGADTGFVVSRDPATVRVPDVSFVRQARLADLGDPNRFGQVVPELVVEIISPNDTWREVLAKAGMWLGAGVQVVWIVDAASREVIALTPDSPPRTFAVTDQLAGDPVLPGFALLVADIFP